MLVVATLLFGSLARADQTEGSDTDLLLISLEREIRHVSIGRLSLFLYPWRQLQKDARDGDLFVCHLVREAKPIIDPDGYLSKLRGTFQFRSSYAAEISKASDFGWFLVKFGSDLNSQLLMKRALWCVRTILIARSAERREPVFAPERLAEQTSSVSAQNLLRNRRVSFSGTALRDGLRQFLNDEVGCDGTMEHFDRFAFIKKFSATSNKVALQTLRQEDEAKGRYFGYELLS